MYWGHKIQDCNMTCQIIIKNNTGRRQALRILIYLSYHIYIWTFNGKNCVKSAEYSAYKLWNSTTSNSISKPPNKLHKTALEQMIYMDPWEVRSNPLYRPLVAEKSILNKSFPEMASVISGHPNAIWCVFIWSFESLNYSVQDLKQSSEVFFILILNQSSYISWCMGRKSKAANNIVMRRMATTLAQNFKDTLFDVGYIEAFSNVRV